MSTMHTKSDSARGVIFTRRGISIFVILMAVAIGWSTCRLIGSRGQSIVAELEARGYSVSGGTLIRFGNSELAVWARVSSYGPFIFFRRNVSAAYKKDISEEDLELISRLPYLDSVSFIRSSAVGSEGLEHLAQVSRLKKVCVFESTISERGLRALKESRSIEELLLGYSGITDEGVGHISKMRQLTRLDLSAASITDSGLESLVGMPCLRSLLLNDANITDAGLEHLRLITSLRFVDLTGTKTTLKAREAIKSKLRDCTFYW